ncbi:MAG: ribonuclease Z [archaeon]|nr:MAG: ribonuclease Z [archaeon]
MVNLTVTFLGTSSAAPTRDRSLPAIAIQREGEVILLDCGEGAQRQFLAQGLGLNKDMTVLVTHLHGDHVTGLLGLLQTMSLAQRTKPLTVVAPAALSKWLKVTSELLNVGLTFKINFITSRPGVLAKTKSFRIRAARADHSVEAYSYMVEEHERPGVFYPKKAKALGIPEGKLWSRLQGGRTASFAGKVFRPTDVTGQRRHGRKIGYSGDTRPSPRLARFFLRSDLLIFDSTFKGADWAKAVERKHSTCVEAAKLARSAKVRKLVLTHFSARYSDVSSLVSEARRVFRRTVAASDGARVEVPYPPS